MDTKQPQMDPKLKEAYDRVMSGPATPPTAAAPTNGAAQPVQPIPAAPPMPQAQPQFTPPPPPPAQATMPPNIAQTSSQAFTPGASPVGSTVAFNANNAGKNQGTTVVKKGGGSKTLLMVVIIFLVLVLLVVYAAVWIVIFKVKVPFLPSL